MAKIRIQIPYSDLAFDRLVDLQDSGFISRDLVSDIDRSIGQPVIITPQYEYIKGAESATVQDARYEITASGASWFSTEHNEMHKAQGAWQGLLESVSKSFHEKYSFLEYAPTTAVVSSEIVEKDKSIIANLLTIMLSDSDMHKNIIGKVHIQDNDSCSDDLYGASLHMRISNGTGEPKPILGKVFFRYEAGNNMVPVRARQMEPILKSFNQINDEDRSVNPLTDHQSDIDTVGSVINMLGDLCGGELQDYIIIEDKRDKEAINLLMDKVSGNITTMLTCHQLEVLCVYHVRVDNRQYNVLYDNKIMYNVSVGVGNNMDVRCMLCENKEYIIRSNQVLIHDEDSIVPVDIDVNSANLGLSAGMLEQVKANNIMRDHALANTCSMADATTCVRLVCRHGLIECNDNGKLRQVCATCPYPQMVHYYAPDNAYYYTKSLRYCEDMGTLAPESSICKVCGRGFSHLGSNKVCDFCNTLVNRSRSSAVSQRHNKLYRMYSGILPLRLRARRSVGLCIEDDDIILFELGGDKGYAVFDKREIREGAFLPKIRETK